MNPAGPTVTAFQLLRDEHRDGLLFADRLHSYARKVSAERLADYTRWYWVHHIRPHFFHEEKILLPFLPVGSLLAKRLKDEHADIRDLILLLDREQDAHDFRLLAKLLEHHIRFEETELFPWLEKNLSATELEQIHVAIIASAVHGSHWTDPFWKAAD